MFLSLLSMTPDELFPVLLPLLVFCNDNPLFELWAHYFVIHVCFYLINLIYFNFFFLWVKTVSERNTGIRLLNLSASVSNKWNFYFSNRYSDDTSNLLHIYFVNRGCRSCIFLELYIISKRSCLLDDYKWVVLNRSSVKILRKEESRHVRVFWSCV